MGDSSPAKASCPPPDAARRQRIGKRVFAAAVAVVSASVVLWLASGAFMNTYAIVLPIDVKFFAGRDMFAPPLMLVACAAAGQYLLVLGCLALLEGTGHTTARAVWTIACTTLAATLVLLGIVGWAASHAQRNCPRCTVQVERVPGDSSGAWRLLDEYPCAVEFDRARRELRLYPGLLVGDVIHRFKEAGWDVSPVE